MPEEVHVWRVSLERSPAEVAALALTLGPDEHQRAGRFHFQKDRTAFVVARGSLRTLLARYLEQPPQALRFDYGPQGKPRLSSDGPSFNLAHSGSLALIAIGGGPAIGVDLERIDPRCPVGEIAGRFFSPEECQVLFSHPAEEHERIFFTCWARKEAFIKAAGGGLSIPLHQFDVVWPGIEGPSLRQRGTQVPGQWSLSDLPAPAEGYAAALAVDLIAPTLRCWSAG